ncbi:MAG: L-2-amino-thiazoline-4-carboxylic acid hydrolase, partial [Acidimicrobiales bacterium]|nr:L-2-amino-thiazoline-4-carboxylic acid hydrolase [Acidimicrobiales bacterium]
MESTPQNQRPDTLNDIGVLKRREIEARIVAPLIERFAEEFGEEQVTQLARETVVDVARSQGAVLAELMGGNDLARFADSMENWTKGGALEIEIQ